MKTVDQLRIDIIDSAPIHGSRSVLALSQEVVWFYGDRLSRLVLSMA